MATIAVLNFSKWWYLYLTSHRNTITVILSMSIFNAHHFGATDNIVDHKLWTSTAYTSCCQKTTWPLIMVWFSVNTLVFTSHQGVDSIHKTNTDKNLITTLAVRSWTAKYIRNIIKIQKYKTLYITGFKAVTRNLFPRCFLFLLFLPAFLLSFPFLLSFSLSQIAHQIHQGIWEAP